MKIAIVGIGNVGGGLTRAARAAGHEVTVYAHDAAAVTALAAESGAKAARSVREAAGEAEVVVLAVPYGELPNVLADLGSAADGKILIDVTNPLNATFSGLASSSSAAEEVQLAVPRARVVKAFNTIFASRHRQPTEDGVPLDAFYAGDDADAKARVAELVTSLGYRPIDVGALRMARHLESMAFLNIHMNASRSGAWQSGWRLVGPVA